MSKFAKIKRASREIVQISDSPINVNQTEGDMIVVQVSDDAEVGDIAPDSAGHGQQQSREQQKQQQGQQGAQGSDRPNAPGGAQTGTTGQGQAAGSAPAGGQSSSGTASRGQSGGGTAA